MILIELSNAHVFLCPRILIVPYDVDIVSLEDIDQRGFHKRRQDEKCGRQITM